MPGTSRRSAACRHRDGAQFRRLPRWHPSGDTLGLVYDFAGDFPLGYSLNGQLLPINADTNALFTLLGATYGGDGINNFALPDLQGTALLGAGTGTGLSTETLGTPTGTSTVILDISQLPAHDHTVTGDDPTAVSRRHLDSG